MNQKQKWMVAAVTALAAAAVLGMGALVFRHQEEPREPLLRAEEQPQPEALQPEEPQEPQTPEEPDFTQVEMKDLGEEAEPREPRPEPQPESESPEPAKPQPDPKPQPEAEPEPQPEAEPEQKPDYQEAGPDETAPVKPPVAPDPEPETPVEPLPPYEPEPYEPEPYEPAPYEPPVEEDLPITLPYTIPDTDLVIDRVRSYQGVYLEDGNETETDDVAAMVLINRGRECVDYAKITLEGSSKTLVFEPSGLEAGATMVVMEASQSPMVHQEYEAIQADVAFTPDFELSRDQLEVEELKNGALRVTNLTQEDIPCIRLFYKFYMANKNVYVGGITYMVKIDGLAAGASTEITPSHYARGKSRVIMAKTYDSDAE